MKTRVFSLLIMCLLFTGPLWADNNSFAVVELFASEGCSSCPPADDLLRELTSQARAQGKRIFTLSFEVDYWDYLGWPDPFSSPQFTKRQHRYADVLQSSSVYTPQMIINGAKGFVGSDEASARKYIDQYLKEPGGTIGLEVKNSGPQNMEITYDCAQLYEGALIHFAVVERGLESRVTAGENAGRTLKHDNIVREFKTVPLTQKQGTISLAKPATDDPGKFSIIAYVQNTNDMHVIAANSIDLTTN